MLTLGVHDGHTATAALFEDGEIIAAISEERLNRKKEWNGFPELAIRKCLEITGKTVGEIDAVGVCSLMPQIGFDSYLKPHGYKKLFSYASKILPEKFLQSPKNVPRLQKLAGYMFKGRQRELKKDLLNLGIKTEKVYFFEHHLLHASSAYYLNWNHAKETLVVTLDGSGDAVCASINIGRDGKLERVAAVFNYNSICDFYTRVTQFLGMKPMSHEYKVMGMAPYASDSGKARVMKHFKKYFRVSKRDPLQFINTSGLWKWQFMKEFRKNLVGERFDWIAGAAQDFFEEVLTQWVANALDKTGIGHLALSGGGFMNVKLNYRLSQLPQVKSLFVFPSCGDESNPVGAAVQAALHAGFPAAQIKPLGMIYWGPAYDNAQAEKAIGKKLAGTNMKVKRHEDIDQIVAGKVAAGKIVGRMTGRMEWGARALGNRSILADARDPKIIHRINRAIKMRDFWMPFAPAILEEYRKKYLILREDYRSPFMTIASETQPIAWEEIPAGLHPFDHTARAQILDPVNHPSFHALVSEFARLTGVGGVLNTSFNLHGDPIVCTPEDAIDTFLRSELDVLQLENYLVEK